MPHPLREADPDRWRRGGRAERRLRVHSEALGKVILLPNSFEISLPPRENFPA